jgi:hypothetical protein
MDRGYDPKSTTTEELWATGLGAAPQREAVFALLHLISNTRVTMTNASVR